MVHSNIKDLESKINQGFNFIAYGDDMVFISEFHSESNKLKNLKVK